MRVGPITPTVPTTCAVDLVRRGDDAALVERRDARLAADEDLHAVGALAHLEQLHEQGLPLEELEQLPQAPHVGGEVGGLEQVALAGDDVALGALRERLVARLERELHQAGHVLAQLPQLVVDRGGGCRRS